MNVIVPTNTTLLTVIQITDCPVDFQKSKDNNPIKEDNKTLFEIWFGWFMVFNATFNNISAISWYMKYDNVC
jgi:hypothetical protein